LSRWQSFGKNVGELLLGGEVGDSNVAIGLMFMNYMVGYVDVLGLLVLFRVSHQANGGLVVRIEDSWVRLRMVKLFQKTALPK
jgi:hypothetical protein